MIRITGGQLQGRKILTPAGQNTRPTLSMVREALFNSIQTVTLNSNVLDLFSGSGALGIEALSRGASRVDFVESSRQALTALKKNLKDLDLEERSRVYPYPIERAEKKLILNAPYQIILADPPYEKGWAQWLIDRLPWESLLDQEGVFILECDKKEVLPQHSTWLRQTREKIYGTTKLLTFQKQTVR